MSHTSTSASFLFAPYKGSNSRRLLMLLIQRQWMEHQAACFSINTSSTIIIVNVFNFCDEAVHVMVKPIVDLNAASPYVYVQSRAKSFTTHCYSRG